MNIKKIAKKIWFKFVWCLEKIDQLTYRKEN